MNPPPTAAFIPARSDFVYWAMYTYFKPMVQSFVGMPKGFPLTSETEAELTGLMLTTLPSNKRIDGMVDDSRFQTSEFYEEISQSSPYSVYKIKTPVLLINALDDSIAVPENVRGLSEKFPNATLFTVPDGGHALLGHTKEIEAEITQFLLDNGALKTQ